LNIKETLELVVSVIGGLSWPLVVGMAILVFRKPITELIGKLESAKGPGVEATFFQNAMADPTSSDETKDELAEIWKAISQARGQKVPVEAQVQLGLKAARRGRPASTEVKKTLAARDYVDEVRKAMLRGGIESKQISTYGGNPIGWHDPKQRWHAASFSIQPSHGVGNLQVHAEDEPSAELLRGIAIDAAYAKDHGEPYDFLLVTKRGLPIENVATCRWSSSADDAVLAAALEKLGAFDYVEDEPADAAV